MKLSEPQRKVLQKAYDAWKENREFRCTPRELVSCYALWKRELLMDGLPWVFRITKEWIVRVLRSEQ